jgi:hypothetical protein
MQVVVDGNPSLDAANALAEALEIPFAKLIAEAEAERNASKWDVLIVSEIPVARIHFHAFRRSLPRLFVWCSRYVFAFAMFLWISPPSKRHKQPLAFSVATSHEHFTFYDTGTVSETVSKG